MNTKNEILQWLGAGFIVAGHVLNTLGSSYHNDIWNIVSFTIGTLLFLTWAIRVRNKPQLTVNAISIAIMLVGLFNAV